MTAHACCTIFRQLPLLAAVVAIAMAAVAGPAAADLVVRYDFTDQPGNQDSQAAADVISGVTAGNLARGPYLTATTAADSINSSHWAPDDYRDDAYYGFTLTPTGGPMTLTRISFADRRNSNGIRNFEIRSSLDSFSTAIPGTFTSVLESDTSVRQESFTLSASFVNLADALTFRIYGYASKSSSGQWRLANYDGSAGGSYSGGLIVEGTATAVPESSAFLFAGLALSTSGLLTARHYRRNRKAKAAA